MLIQAYGVEDLLTPGCIMACSNLQWTVQWCMSLYSGFVMLLQAYGVEDLLTPGCIMACSNLQWRADDGGGV